MIPYINYKEKIMKISKLLVASVVASSFLLGNVAVDTASLAEKAKKEEIERKLFEEMKALKEKIEILPVKVFVKIGRFKRGK